MLTVPQQRVSLFRTHESKSAPKGGPSLTDRALGAFLGVAIGDALGAPVEFMTASEIAAMHKVHRNLTGGGWLRLKPGQVTDDTQMALALGSAICTSGGWNLRAIADAYVGWMRSRPVDIGNTCRRGIRRYLSDGSLCAQPAREDGGNGAAMRNLPTVLASLQDEELVIRRSLEQAHITHYQEQSDAGTVALARMTRALLLGEGKDQCRRLADELVEEHCEFRFDPWPGNASGYIVDTVQTVLDAFFETESFEECLIRVVNRGGDADTTGVLAGQLAGALYGVQAIPGRWIKQLDPVVNAAISRQTPDLLAVAEQSSWNDGQASRPQPPAAAISSMRRPDDRFTRAFSQDASRSPTLINRCNLPPWLISSEEFQADPRPIEIDGIRSTDQWLFKRLAAIDDPRERSRVFHDYISVKFRLHEWAEHQNSARSSLRHSYVQFLHGWGADSNGHAGAVLKAWVESRFGILATYHGGRLADDEAARERFVIDRMRGASRTMGALMQLDLLYTFCQDELQRRFPGERWKKLYRGTHDPEEYAICQGSVNGQSTVRLNNLSSFTADPEVAWEFGSRAWEVSIPLPKIVFFSGLLPQSLLGGESEYLVIGGYYRVKTLLY